MKKLLVVLSILISVCSCVTHKVIENGDSNYDIVISSTASQTEKFAAKDLQSHLKQISGAEIDIVRPGQGKRNHRIIIGYNSDTAELLPELQCPDPEDQTFTYRNVGGDIVIYGGCLRGTMYGVHSFLEREFGCHWFSPDYSVIPERSSWSFDRLDHSESPYIQDRFLFFTAGYDVLWSARNRDMFVQLPDSTGKKWKDCPMRGFNMGHSFGYWMVPQKRHWKTHPEYYSMIDGKRINGYTQLCLSNPEVLKICINRTRQAMKIFNYSIIDVSQNDSSPYCHCDRCMAMIDSLGNATDLLLWFVNQVADAVKDEFPDRYVGTFSYEWSIPSPKTVRPHDNVVVRLCTYDNCIAHPLAECEHNREWIENMKRWSDMCKHFYIWHYLASFRQYHVPFPFIDNLVPDIKLFKEMGAVGVLEEGEYQGPGGNFQELKTWLLAKLMWDPDQDLEELLDTFFDGYYRESSASVREYFDYTQTLADSGIHDFCYPKFCESKIFNEDFTRHALELAKAAEASCTDSLTRKHVLVATLPAHYLHARSHPAESLQDGTYEHIMDVVKLAGIKFLSEWGDVVRPNQLEYVLKYDAGIIKE